MIQYISKISHTSLGSDFISVSKLAWNVYTAYKDAPEDFKNISDEINSLHIIVDRHKDTWNDKCKITRLLSGGILREREK